MPEIKQVGNKIRYSVEMFDGGLNTNDAPSKILPNESPDCLNVVFDDEGAVKTRFGSDNVNATHIISLVTQESAATADFVSYRIQDAASFKQNIVLWTTKQDNDSTPTTVVNMMVGTPTGASSVSGSYTFTVLTAPTDLSGNLVQINPDTRIAHVVYQDILFFSDGITSFKYDGSGTYKRMGISIDASGPAVATTASGGTQLAAGTYYYRISHENTQVVEGQAGPVSPSVTVPASGSVKITGIPDTSTWDAINKKYIYRSDSASGPFRRVTSVWDIAASAATESIGPAVTQVFDNTPIGQEGRLAILDAGEPPPFTTIALHKERLFINDTSNANNKSYIWWANFTNPFVVEAESFDLMNNGDGEFVSAIIPQDDVVTIFKQSKGWGIVLQDPSDQLTWVKKEHANNIGIYSPYSGVRVQNGIFFLGRKENKVTGFHLLTGLQVIESFDGKLRSLTVSKKIEPTVFDLIPNCTLPTTSWTAVSAALTRSLSDTIVSIFEYKNRIFLTFKNKELLTYNGDGSEADLTNFSQPNSQIIWFDLNRLNIQDSEGIGSWARWDGPPTLKFFSHRGSLYSIDHSTCDTYTTPTTFKTNGINTNCGGYVRKFEIEDRYNDSGAAIDSYFYTKEFGGSESAIESYYKDLRDIYLWYKQLGDYQFNVYIRRDGDEGIGSRFRVGMTGDTTAAWGSAAWGTSVWGDSLIGSATNRIGVGGLLGRRFQFRFDNQNTANQGFQINRLEMDFNVRRRR